VSCAYFPAALRPERGRGMAWRTPTVSMSRLGWERLASDSMSSRTPLTTGASTGCCPNLGGPWAAGLPGAGGATSNRGRDVGVAA